MTIVTESPTDEIVCDEQDPSDGKFTMEAWRTGSRLTGGLYGTLDEAQEAVRDLVDEGWSVLISTLDGLPVMASFNEPSESP